MALSPSSDASPHPEERFLWENSKFRKVMMITDHRLLTSRTLTLIRLPAPLPDLSTLERGAVVRLHDLYWWLGNGNGQPTLWSCACQCLCMFAVPGGVMREHKHQIKHKHDCTNNLCCPRRPTAPADLYYRVPPPHTAPSTLHFWVMPLPRLNCKGCCHCVKAKNFKKNPAPSPMHKQEKARSPSLLPWSLRRPPRSPRRARAGSVAFASRWRL